MSRSPWPSPCRADPRLWRNGAGPRVRKFIVYSNGREAALREYVQKLEIYDYIMRVRLGLPIDALPDRKFPIYLVNGRRDLLRVHPASHDNVAGTYFPVEEDIFAVAIRGDGDDTLLHEYAHHFMFQNSHAVYPGWLTEGFAEYFMTADIRSDQVVIGGFNEESPVLASERQLDSAGRTTVQPST